MTYSYTRKLEYLEQLKIQSESRGKSPQLKEHYEESINTFRANLWDEDLKWGEILQFMESLFAKGEADFEKTRQLLSDYELE